MLTKILIPVTGAAVIGAGSFDMPSAQAGETATKTVTVGTPYAGPSQAEPQKPDQLAGKPRKPASLLLPAVQAAREASRSGAQ